MEFGGFGAGGFLWWVIITLYFRDVSVRLVGHDGSVQLKAFCA